LIRLKQTLKKYVIPLIKSCLVFIILFYPIGFVHELGHLLVGYSFDSSCVLNYSLMKVTCSPTPQPEWLYFSLGGIFGLVAGSSLFMIKKFRITKWIFIGIIITVFDQLAKVLFETLAHQAYLNDIIIWYIGGLDFAVLITLVLYYQKRLG